MLALAAQYEESIMFGEFMVAPNAIMRTDFWSYMIVFCCFYILIYSSVEQSQLLLSGTKCLRSNARVHSQRCWTCWDFSGALAWKLSQSRVLRVHWTRFKPYILIIEYILYIYTYYIYIIYIYLYHRYSYTSYTRVLDSEVDGWLMLLPATYLVCVHMIQMGRRLRIFVIFLAQVPLFFGNGKDCGSSHWWGQAS